MTKQEAYRLLHPSTTGSAIRELELHNGISGRLVALNAIDEACLIACDCIKKCIEMEDDRK